MKPEAEDVSGAATFDEAELNPSSVSARGRA